MTGTCVLVCTGVGWANSVSVSPILPSSHTSWKVIHIFKDQEMSTVSAILVNSDFTENLVENWKAFFFLLSFEDINTKWEKTQVIHIHLF